MAEEFNAEEASRHQREIITEVQRIRNGINLDVIDYYFDRHPQSAEEERDHREGIRKYLRIAGERIDDLLRGRLNE